MERENKVDESLSEKMAKSEYPNYNSTKPFLIERMRQTGVNQVDPNATKHVERETKNKV